MIPSWFPAVYAETMQLLPAKMDSPQARAMLKAIALQESRFEHRKQIGGPARGFWQFEQGGGVRGVLNHPYSREHIRRILTGKGLDLGRHQRALKMVAINFSAATNAQRPALTNQTTPNHGVCSKTPK